MRLVAHDVAKHFFDVESGWLRTVRELTLAPGAMIRRYVQGHRKAYTNPVAYLVLATAMSVVIQNLVGFHDRMVTIARSNTLDSPLQMEFINRFTELVFQGSWCRWHCWFGSSFEDQATTWRRALSSPCTRVGIQPF